jgi:hypothetical protein
LRIQHVNLTEFRDNLFGLVCSAGQSIHWIDCLSSSNRCHFNILLRLKSHTSRRISFQRADQFDRTKCLPELRTRLKHHLPRSCFSSGGKGRALQAIISRGHADMSCLHRISACPQCVSNPDDLQSCDSSFWINVAGFQKTVTKQDISDSSANDV